jgi:hypothetical protein
LLYTGSYFAAGIAGKYEVNGNSGKIDFGSSASDDLKPFDFGLNFGIGFQIKNLQITSQYSLGLSDLNPDKLADVHVKMSGIFFSLAYLIGK